MSSTSLTRPSPRVLLADKAERSIDAQDFQHFIWHGDAVGTLMWQALWNGAERGLRVRLLLDDANTCGLDTELAALDAHPGGGAAAASLGRGRASA